MSAEEMPDEGAMPDDERFDGPEGDTGDECTEAPPHLGLVGDADEEPWRRKLITVEKEVGRGAKKRKIRVVLPTLANAITFLTDHPRWAGLLAHNDFAERIETVQAPPWDESECPAHNAAGELVDSDTSRLLAWFERAERLRFGERTIEQAIPVVAERNAYHPVRTYLRELRWDARQRLPDVLATHFSCASTPYTRAIGVRWFIQAIARVMLPGCQADCTLVLESPQQGWYKTSAFRELVPVREWYSDTGIEIGNKDSMQTLHGVWIYGLDELDSLSRSEITRAKTFLTQTVDRFRPPFGKRPRDFRRQNVFVGSTNSTEYLTDKTGNRRFWPGRLLRPIDLDAIRRDRDQLWAEALSRFESGEKWHVDTPALRQMCEDEQRERVADDAWLPLVAEWLAAPEVTVPDPSDGLYAYRTLDLANGITTADVLMGAIRMRASDIGRAEAMRAGDILRDLGFTEPKRDPTGDRLRRYFKPTSETGS
jgi:predicted P-loop ATPase